MPCLISGWEPSSDDAETPQSPSSHDVESTPTPRRGEPGYIKRPRNSFIIFRCEYVQKNRGTPAPSGERYKRLSKRASEAWQKLSKEEREEYVRKSELEKEDHSQRHPNYVYRPNKKRRQAGGGVSGPSTRPVRHQQVRDMIERRRVVESQPHATTSPSPVPSHYAASAIDFKHSPSPSLAGPAISRQSSFSFSPSSTPSVPSPPSLRSSSPSWEFGAPSPAIASMGMPATPPSGYDTPYTSALFAENVARTVTYSEDGLIVAPRFSYLQCDPPYSTPLVAQDIYLPPPPSPCDSAGLLSPSPLAPWASGADTAATRVAGWLADPSANVATSQPYRYSAMPPIAASAHSYAEAPAGESSIGIRHTPDVLSPSPYFPEYHPAPDAYYPLSAGFPPNAFIS